MVSKTSRFALLSESPFVCSYYGGVGACERARGGGRARKTGIQLAGTALTDRQGTLHQIGPTTIDEFDTRFIGFEKLQLRIHLMFGSIYLCETSFPKIKLIKNEKHS
ncbi:hypothetical protein ALC56_04576 [Trachymyrmex septentrionalis]|uniref:Uncharacterized protein n=1 Tax=Trachymyrmex septentrionalis TaxID=34720 RepID=A0A195FKP3_9HYME|nr:hypothetical protein ALC56_04576 [Trachymyrmex septentrionalis]